MLSTGGSSLQKTILVKTSFNGAQYIRQLFLLKGSMFTKIYPRYILVSIKLYSAMPCFREMSCFMPYQQFMLVLKKKQILDARSFTAKCKAFTIRSIIFPLYLYAYWPSTPLSWTKLRLNAMRMATMALSSSFSLAEYSWVLTARMLGFTTSRRRGRVSATNEEGWANDLKC